jgi:hypothetical protein
VRQHHGTNRRLPAPFLENSELLNRGGGQRPGTNTPFLLPRPLYRGGRIPLRRLRATLLLVTMMLGVLAFSGVALAKDITGTNGRDNLKGTNKADTLRALGGPRLCPW